MESIIITILAVSNVFWIIYGLFIKDRIQNGFINRIETLEILNDHFAKSLDHNEVEIERIWTRCETHGFFIGDIMKQQNFEERLKDKIMKQIYGDGTT